MRIHGVSVAACLAGALVASTSHAAAPVGPGDADRSFGSRGRVTVSLARSITPTIALAVRPSGGLLISATTGTTLPRRSDLFALTRTGRTDRAFAGGRVGLGRGPNAAVTATTHDGVTFVAQSIPQGGLRVRKLGASGRPDPGFGGGGSATVPTNGTRVPQAIAVGRDGKIVITSSTPGSDDIVSPEGPDSVIRLLASGHLDPTFAKGGEYLSMFGDGGVGGVGLLPDGRVMIAAVGSVGFPSTGEVYTRLLRLTADGQLDKSFGPPNGYLVVMGSGSFPDQFTHFALDRQSRPLLAGTAGSDVNGLRGQVAVRRYTTSGQADTSFGQGGQFTLRLGKNSPAGASAVALDPQGRVVVAGTRLGTETRSNTTYRGLAVRLTARGRLDRTFGSNGLARGRPGTPWSSLLINGNRISLGGATGTLGQATSRYEITRLLGGDDRAKPRVTVKRSCRARRITVRIADASPLKPTRMRLDSGRARTTRRTTVHLRADRRAHRLSIRAADIAGNRRAMNVRVKRCR